MIKSLLLRFSVARDLLEFLWKERLWWMIPFVLTLLIVAILLIFAQTSPVAPFIYTLF